MVDFVTIIDFFAKKSSRFSFLSLTKPSQCVTMKHKGVVVIIFAEKLNFLMRLTSTTNSRLASAISVDPSLISKLRSGARTVSVKSDYLLPMSTYFGSKCADSYRSLTLLELIGADFGVDVVSSLVKWFLDDEKTVDISYSYAAASGNYLNKKAEKRRKEKFYYFHGINAVGDATELMKDIIAASDNIKTIKILSDCSNKDGGFDLFLSCKELLSELAEKGTEIIRILPDYFTLTQSLNDVFAWLPMISEGKTKSYYFNGFRDRAVNSSMLIVPGVAAMFSESVDGIGPTVVTTEKSAIADCGKMFDSYLSYCREGSRTEAYSEKRNGVIEEFFQLKDDMCCVFSSLPCETAFENKDVYCKYTEQLKNLMKTNTVTQIFPLHSPLKIAEGKTPYTAKQYSECLEMIINLLENEPNYRVIISANNESGDSGILIKKKGGLIKLPENINGHYSLITHQPSVNALWQYYMNGCGNITEFDCSGDKVIMRMKKLVAELKK